jgi:hypothetical protein
MANNRKDVFFIKKSEKEGGKPFWMRIGTVWVNKDGSMNLKLDVPTIPSMDIQLRDPVEREDKFE